MTDPPQRRWYRLHASTWLVLLLGLGVVALLELPGRRTEVDFGPMLQVDGVEHGWPWPYLTRASLGRSVPFSLWSWTDDVHEFRSGMLAVNLYIGISMALLTAALFEAWRRRRQGLFQISLRELLVLLLVFAILAAWVGNYHRSMNAQIAAVGRIEAESDEPRCRVFWKWGSRLPDWIEELIGDPSMLTPPLLGDVTRLEVHVNGQLALKELACFPKLEELVVHYSDVHDEDLERIISAPRLKQIDLSGNPITDRGLEHLITLQHLKVIDLAVTNVTDAGMKHLAHIHTLRDLNLSNTEVTDEGVTYLKQALPEIVISDD